MLAIAGLGTACSGKSAGSPGLPGASNTAPPLATGAAPAAALARVYAGCQQTTWKASLRLTADLAGQNAVITADELADPRHRDHVVGHMISSAGLEQETPGDGSIYLRLGNTQWSKVDAAALPAGYQRLPCNEFTALSGPGIADAEELSDQAGGSAHHYRFHGDAYALLSASVLYSPQTLGVFQKAGVQLSADLYTDASGRPLTYQTDTAVTHDPDGGMVTMSLLETYSDFGTAVDVAAPDPAQVTDQLPAGLQLESPPKP
jgi:hypothetical protein